MSKGANSGRRERRKHPRGAAAATAVIDCGEFLGPYLVENLSAGGALLIGEPPLSIGSRAQLVIQLPDCSSLRVAARVVRQSRRREGPVFAVAFRGLPDSVEDRIQELVLESLERQRAENAPSVLILDDLPHICRTLERHLRALGRRAMLATTPLAAIHAIENAVDAIDMAFVDLRLGSSDGVEMLCFLEEEHPHIHRVLMSGAIGPDQLELALASGRAHSVLHKPWNLDDLETILREGTNDRQDGAIGEPNVILSDAPAP